MKKLILFLLFAPVCLPVHADELQEKHTYRLDKTFHDLVRVRDNQDGFIAVQNSKFVVIDNQVDPNAYIVRFIKLYDRKYNGKMLKSTVSEDEEYRLPRMSAVNVPIEKSVRPSLVGPVSGPLIVPFKYRTDDDSLSGEAAIGFYAGYRTEFRIPGTNARLPMSPFIAGGLSQINVSTDGDTDNKTGVTLAVGILIQNWADVNIGLVYGQDRIGDNSWEHEGENWISFMVGWDL